MIHNNGETSNSPRRRKLTNWEVISVPSPATEVEIYHLYGQTVEEHDGFQPPARLTKTSPIASVDGNVVTTASGSQYTLLEPAPGQGEITPLQQNPWIDGDNWLDF